MAPAIPHQASSPPRPFAVVGSGVGFQPAKSPVSWQAGCLPHCGKRDPQELSRRSPFGSSTSMPTSPRRAHATAAEDLRESGGGMVYNAVVMP